MKRSLLAAFCHFKAMQRNDKPPGTLRCPKWLREKKEQKAFMLLPMGCGQAGEGIRPLQKTQLF